MVGVGHRFPLRQTHHPCHRGRQDMFRLEARFEKEKERDGEEEQAEGNIKNSRRDSLADDSAKNGSRDHRQAKPQAAGKIDFALTNIRQGAREGIDEKDSHRGAGEKSRLQMIKKGENRHDNKSSADPHHRTG